MCDSVSKSHFKSRRESLFFLESLLSLFQIGRFVYYFTISLNNSERLRMSKRFIQNSTRVTPGTVFPQGTSRVSKFLARVFQDLVVK